MLERGAADLGHDVQLLNLSPGRVVSGGAATASNLTRSLRDVRQTARAARHADVVNIHSAVAPVVTAVRAGALAAVARRTGARTVIHAHGGRLAQEPPQGLAAVATRRALSAADLVVAVSSTVHEMVIRLGVPAERVVFVPNGIDLERFGPSSAPHSPPRVLYVGGLTKRKGVLDLGHASSELLRRGLDHELWLVGGVPDEGKQAWHEVREALPSHARLLGEQPSSALPGIYAECDIFCLPSWWEAMPFTVLEAQAAGLPVVASDVGDVASMVEDGKSGILVEARDSRGLASALAELVANESTRLRMGVRAREVSRCFNQRDTLRSLGRTFSELVEG